ncbi:MAG: tripartite tricarboxylate transporter substrate binding protein [Burkholderiales bacterium]|nr:tripartite tricarboxylate transporter substrate binding protein [Burkholderiales bacterium]
MFRPLASLLAIGLIAVSAQAQTYPEKNIRMVIPFPPGGGTDILGRLVAQKLTEANKWTIVPDNKAGAGGTLGITEASRGQARRLRHGDGPEGQPGGRPWLYKNLPWNPVKDFAPVAHVAWSPVIIATGVNSKFKTLADVVAAAKAAPDTITYGLPGNGTTIHLAGDQFEKAAGIKLRHVPYKWFQPGADGRAGRQRRSAGVVRALGDGAGQGWQAAPLAVTRPSAAVRCPRCRRWPVRLRRLRHELPGTGLLMPAGTPAPIVAQMNGAVNKLLATPELQKAIQDQAPSRWR